MTGNCLEKTESKTKTNFLGEFHKFIENFVKS